MVFHRPRAAKKGSKVYLEGQLQTRKWEKEGQDHYSTEVVLQGFNSTLTMLDSRAEGGSGDYAGNNGGGSDFGRTGPMDSVELKPGVHLRKSLNGE